MFLVCTKDRDNAAIDPFPIKPKGAVRYRIAQLRVDMSLVIEAVCGDLML